MNRRIDRKCPLCETTKIVRTVVKDTFDEAKLSSFSFSSRKSPEQMHFRMVLCAECCLLYASPIPVLDWFQDEYEKADFNAEEESAQAASTYSEYLMAFLGKLPDLKGALDIGAGDGTFIEKLVEAGLEGVAGVEPSLRPVSLAKPEIRPLIRTEFFDVNNFEPSSFSLITCFQTLEHLPEPKKLFEDVFTLLRPGGMFYTVSHDYASFTTKILGSRSPIFDIEHLQLFSPKSLSYCYRKSGFINVEISPLVNSYNLSYLLKLMPMPHGLKAILSGIFDKTGLGGVILPLRLGNMFAVGFKPPNR
jgi:SAM-dependent methyltransferase